MSDYTSGTWHCSEGRIFSATDDYVASTNPYLPDGNARLIAAAPELFKVVEGMLGHMEVFSWGDGPTADSVRQLVQDAKALVARIEGDE